MKQTQSAVKTRASESGLVLVFLLIGWKSGASFLSQSCDVPNVKPIAFRHPNGNRSKPQLITIQLKPSRGVGWWNGEHLLTINVVWDRFLMWTWRNKWIWFAIGSSVLESIFLRRAIFIEHKFPKILRWGQMAYKFPGKVSITSDDCWIFVQPKIPQILGGIQKSYPKILCRNCEFVPFFGSAGKCWSIRRHKYSEMQTRLFGWMERDLNSLILIYPISMDEPFLTTLPELFLVAKFS